MLNELALCSGIGGIGLGLERAGLARAVCHVEWDAYAAGVLVKNMEEGHLGPAPVWDDLRQFDGRPWRGVVDLISAGYPCQPFSVAGRRRGVDDPRHLWPHIARVIGEVGPRLVLLENVPGHLALGFGEVLGELASLGYDAEWDCIPAGAIGAPHWRDRVFILAHANGGGSIRETHKRCLGGVCPICEWSKAEYRFESVSQALRQGRLGDFSGVPRVDDVVPARVDRLRCLGNAVVPQVAEYIGRRIREWLMPDEGV